MSMDLQTATVEYAKVLRRLGQKNVMLDSESRTVLRGIYKKKTEAPSPQEKKSEEKTEYFQPPTRAHRPSAKTDTVPPVETLSFKPTGDKDADMEALRNIVLPCSKCEHLAKSRTNVVYGVGNVRAELMFVGEAPGADEDLQGEPFVGKAGQLLTKMIEAMGLKRSDVYIANVLKCRPDMPQGASGNRKPTPSEMLTCLPYLRAQIAIIQPKVIVTLGSTAIEGLVTPGRTSMASLRGKWQTFDGIPVMPTYHPAYLLRDQSISKKRIVWEDLLAAMEKIGLPISEKQRRYFIQAAQ